MAHHGMNLQGALIEARRIGCEVILKPTSGEAKVRPPKGKGLRPIVVSTHRKDAPRHLTTMLCRLQGTEDATEPRQTRGSNGKPLAGYGIGDRLQRDATREKRPMGHRIEGDASDLLLVVKRAYTCSHSEAVEYVASEVGVTADTVRAWARGQRASASNRSKVRALLRSMRADLEKIEAQLGPQEPREGPYPPELVDLVVRLYRQGWSAGSIARRDDVPYAEGAVGRILDRAGEPRRRLTGPAARVDPVTLRPMVIGKRAVATDDPLPPRGPQKEEAGKAVEARTVPPASPPNRAVPEGRQPEAPAPERIAHISVDELREQVERAEREALRRLMARTLRYAGRAAIAAAAAFGLYSAALRVLGG